MEGQLKRGLPCFVYWRILLSIPQVPFQSVKLALILFICEETVESRERKDVERIQAAGRKRPGYKLGGDRALQIKETEVYTSENITNQKFSTLPIISSVFFTPWRGGVPYQSQVRSAASEPLLLRLVSTEWGRLGLSR